MLIRKSQTLNIELNIEKLPHRMNMNMLLNQKKKKKNRRNQTKKMK